jgi:hypothetical protein
MLTLLSSDITNSSRLSGASIAVLFIAVTLMVGLVAFQLLLLSSSKSSSSPFLPGPPPDPCCDCCPDAVTAVVIAASVDAATTAATNIAIMPACIMPVFDYWFHFCFSLSLFFCSKSPFIL